MALIKCPDCGTDVSDAAAACPRCARPIAYRTGPMGHSQPAASANRGKRNPGGVIVLALLCVGVWIFVQGRGSVTQDAFEKAPQANQSPSTQEYTTPAPAPAAVEVVTPVQLYQRYAANEVATDQELAGKVIQITAPVMSIDKDFTDAAVLRFSTGDEFSSMGVTLSEGDKASAARLTRGQVVTVRCKTVHRIMTSPMASDCGFVDDSQARTDSHSVSPQVDSYQRDENPPSAACSDNTNSAQCEKDKIDALFARMDKADRAKPAQGEAQLNETDPQMKSAQIDQYVQAIQSTISAHWVRPENLPSAACVVHIVQSRGGRVISATVDSSCPYDDAGRLSVEDAVLKSGYLPYAGFESVFQRDVTLAFKR